jgi:hypothetical protein
LPITSSQTKAPPGNRAAAAPSARPAAPAARQAKRDAVRQRELEALDHGALGVRPAAYSVSATSPTPVRASAEKSVTPMSDSSLLNSASTPRGGQRRLRLAAVELVGLGQQHQQPHLPVATRGAISASSCGRGR